MVRVQAQERATSQRESRPRKRAENGGSRTHRQSGVSQPDTARSFGPRTASTVCGLLVLTVALVFGQTATHGFVDYDDGQYVCENAQVREGLSCKGAAWAFTQFHASNWHPLTWLSHMADCHFFGLWAPGHHLTSVAMHAATTVLLFLALRQMTGQPWPSAWVAAVFAVHPQHVESVAWVSERKDVLSGLFFVLTLWAYADYARRPFAPARYGLVMLLCVAGLMSKPMLVTLPCVLLLLDYWPLRRLDEPVGQADRPAGLHRVIVEKFPLAFLAGGACLLTLGAQTAAIMPMETVSFPWRVANAAAAYVGYLGQFFAPDRLAVFYQHPGNTLSVAKVVTAALVLGSISLGAFAWRKRRPWLLVGWLWFLGMLVPVIGLVQVGSQAMADRYMYLPQIGVALAVAFEVADRARGWGLDRRVLRFAACSVVVILAAMACQQTSFWRDNETLWAHVLDCYPTNALGHFKMGVIEGNRGRYEEAAAHYRMALQTKADFADAADRLAACLLRQEKFEPAIRLLQHVLKLRPDSGESHSNFGVALVRCGRFDEAIDQFRQALELQPEKASTITNFGYALAATGRRDEAMAQYRKALDLDPDLADAHYNLALALDEQGRPQEALAHLRRAAKLQPDRKMFAQRLARALATSPAVVADREGDNQ